MTPDSPKDDRDQPADRLAAPLDALVGKIAAEEPPEDVVRRSIERVRQAGPMAADDLSPGSQRRLTSAVALAAAVGLASVLLVWQLMRNDGREVELVEQRDPVRTGRVEIGPPDISSPDGTQVEEKSAASAASAASAPTFWSYHQAARRSPEELDSLLEQHGRQYAFGALTSTDLGIQIELDEEIL